MASRQNAGEVTPGIRERAQILGVMPQLLHEVGDLPGSLIVVPCHQGRVELRARDPWEPLAWAAARRKARMLRPCMIGGGVGAAPGGRTMAICAGLLGFDGSMQLADPVDDVSVRLDEVGSGLLRIFELADLSSEPGPLALEKPSVRFGCLLPGTFGCLQRGGAALETLTAAVPGEEPTAGILGSAEVLLVGSAGRLKVLVASPDGRVGPPSGAGPEIREVLFEGGLLLADLSELVGDERRDAPDELAVLGA